MHKEFAEDTLDWVEDAEEEDVDDYLFKRTDDGLPLA
jgi:hypothetical protein